MIELERRSPLAPVSPHPFLAEHFELRELPHVTKIRVQARRSSSPLTVGSFVDVAANASAGIDPIVLWKAPREWLAYSTSLAADKVLATLRQESQNASLVLTDVSSASVVLELQGQRALDVLMRDCTLDLEGDAVPPGHCAQTTLAQVGVLIHRPAEQLKWRLFVDRSVAGHVWEWIVDTATHGR
jgi:heterotetrameric sarcosine oxidase gamma subunit